jgi:hypothetical protein
MVAGREVDAIAFLALAHDREQEAEERREVLLDVGRDDAGQRVLGWARLTRSWKRVSVTIVSDAVLAQRVPRSRSPCRSD